MMELADSNMDGKVTMKDFYNVLTQDLAETESIDEVEQIPWFSIANKINQVHNFLTLKKSLRWGLV